MAIEEATIGELGQENRLLSSINQEVVDVFAHKIRLSDVIRVHVRFPCRLTIDQEVWIEKVEQGIKGVREKIINDERKWQGERPKTAGEIMVVEDDTGEAKHMGSFDDQLRDFTEEVLQRETGNLIEMIAEAAVNGVGPIEEQKEIAAKIKEIEELVGVQMRARVDYGEFTERAIPELRQATGRINERTINELRNGIYHGECYLGHGADPIYWSVRASRWHRGWAARTHEVLVNIGSAFLTPDIERGYRPEIASSFRSGIREMLIRLGVQANGRWIDTAYYGNACVALIRLLDPKEKLVPKGKENYRISLLRTGGINILGGVATRSTKGIDVVGRRVANKGLINIAVRAVVRKPTEEERKERERTGKKKDFLSRLINDIGDTSYDQNKAVRYLDDSPRFARSPQRLVVNKDGETVTEEIPCSPMEQVRAFAIKQAVIREFLPQPIFKVGRLVVGKSERTLLACHLIS